MSLKYFKFTLEKQPSELLTIAVDYALDLATAEEVSSVTTAAIDLADNSDVKSTLLSGAAQIQTGDATNSRVSQKIQAGTTGHRYKITFLATTSNGNKIEADIILSVLAL